MDTTLLLLVPSTELFLNYSSYFLFFRCLFPLSLFYPTVNHVPYLLRTAYVYDYFFGRVKMKEHKATDL